MPAGVQFRGIDNVVNAFSNRKCNAWSIWSGKQFLFSCVAADETEAAAELSNLLDALDKSGKCVYTLKVYEGLADGTRIGEKLEAHGSFNFRLTEDDEPARVGSYTEVKELRAEIATLKQELEDRDDENEEDESVFDRIGSMFMDDPAKLPLMLQSIQGVLNMFTKQSTVTGQPSPVAIGAVPANDPIKAAIDTLKQHDPQLSKHLTKLAQLAISDPGTFKILLSTLDNM